MLFKDFSVKQTLVKRLSAVASVVAAAGIAVSSLLAPVQQPVAAAASNQIYWGAYINGAPADPTQIDKFETMVGKKMSMEMFGTPWKMNGKYMAFPKQYVDTIRKRGALPVLDWGSQALGGGLNQPNFQLADITNGAHDAYLTSFAQAAAAYGQPFFLRFNAEMNGWWLPWSEQTNGNQPGDFARSWRHVHDIFKREGAGNVSWVFCPNIVGPKSTPLSELYPGDDYVDWTCLDGYNWGTDGNNQGFWMFDQVFLGSSYNGNINSYNEIMKLAPSKPLMIGETASSEDGGRKADYINNMFSTLPTKFPGIRALMWFNWNTNDSTIDWPIESSSASIAAFKAGIQSSYYAGNNFSTMATSPIPPIGGMSAPAPAQAPTTAPITQPVSGTSTGSVTLNPVADTVVRKSNPTSTAGGASTTIQSDLAGTDTAYLRFSLSGLAGKKITSAKLRVKTSTDSSATSASSTNINLVTDWGWQEKYMSYSNAVAISSALLGKLGAATRTSTWYEATLDAATLQRYVGNSLTGSTVSMALQGSASDVLIFYSRESGATNAPQLVVEYQ
jgi:hypothetical protein